MHSCTAHKLEPKHKSIILCRGGSRIGETGVRKREVSVLGGSGGMPPQENFVISARSEIVSAAF